MKSEITHQKKLIDQVYDEMLSSIEIQEDFDTEVIIKLRQLAEKNMLNKHLKVTEAISFGLGENCETPRTRN